MLILKRKVGSSVLIGPECEIEVLVSGIQHDQAELHARYRNAADRISGELARGKYSRDEVLQLGNDISIAVLAVRDDRVTLGFNVPKSYQIHRREIWEVLGNRPDEGSEGDAAGAPVPRKPKPGSDSAAAEL